MIIYFLLLLLPFSLQASLSLEEKIGQLLLVHFNGSRANEDSKTLLHKAHVGGFIYYTWANELSSPKQVAELSASLQKQNRSSIPLLIAVDQEGGRVNRLKEGFTLFPSQEVRGSFNDPAFEKQIAETLGRELSTVGITMNLAPVVDVGTKDRCYSTDPAIVANLGKAALEGYKNSNTLAVLKHFPGHGGVTIDSHEALPVVTTTLKADLVPFQQLCPYADAIMTAHVLAPAIDPKMPATFSKSLLEGVLREQFGFKGVIISDSLVMKGASVNFSVEEAALEALLAGCDILCLGGKLLNTSSQDELTPQNIVQIHSHLVAAVQQGKLPLSSLDQKVQRVLEMKLFSEIKRSLTPEKVQAIGNGVWQNECKGTLDGLVSWNTGENFMSLGIGHFIWYPEGEEVVFDAGFPQYLTYLKSKNCKIPEKIATMRYAPTKLEDTTFLKTWLSKTIDWQASFIIERFLIRLKAIIEASPNKEALLLTLQKITATNQGLFALIDYLNFKGDGLSPKERYAGKGWGLSQVLQALPEDSAAPLEDFQRAAVAALEERVKNSPPERDEKRFLQGWKNRIGRY